MLVKQLFKRTGMLSVRNSHARRVKDSSDSTGGPKAMWHLRWRMRDLSRNIPALTELLAGGSTEQRDVGQTRSGRQGSQGAAATPAQRFS